MPPQALNPDIQSQALYRCHDAHVVYVGFLSDCATPISLDASGLLAIWPPSAAERCGFGWIKPRRTWQFPKSLRTCQARGCLHPIWPVLPGRSGRTTGGSASRDHGKPQLYNSGGWSAAYDFDAQDHADELALQESPKGDFLLTHRLPWMGSAAPAYALSQPLTSTGTEYLIMNLGCGVLGAFSLATGQLVREIATGGQQEVFGAMPP
eukprot:gene6860-7078_t